MQTILIIDYGMGNIASIKKKLDLFNVNTIVSSKSEDVNAADKIILPGIGHFGKAMANLKEYNLLDTLNENALIKKKPFLGICLGMQLMNSYSEEGEEKVKGLNWFEAEVKKFTIEDKQKYKVPLIGWNKINISKPSLLMKDIQNEAEFYFVHSYFCKCKNDNDVLNSTNHEVNFASAIEKENLFGVQYHPEKSHEVGEQLIQNFINL